MPVMEDWTNATLKGRYIDMAPWIDEYVGNDASQLSVQFVDPASVGFDPTYWPGLDVETIVVGKIRIEGTRSPRPTLALPSAYLIH